MRLIEEKKLRNQEKTFKFADHPQTPPINYPISTQIRIYKRLILLSIQI